MAEFYDVMKQAMRMCKAIARCGECPVGECFEDSCPMSQMADVAEEFESGVMAWADRHPESVYPSWNDAWGRLFPNTYKDKAPCLMHFVGCDRKPEVCSGISCDECRDRPIPADIAEKLGIKPVEGTK